MADSSRFSEEGPSIAARVRAMHARGQGGYKTIADFFGISKSTVKGYLRKGSPSDKRHRSRHSCPDKLAHESEADAADAIMAMKRDGLPERNPSRPLGPYFCAGCGRWHVGHARVEKSFPDV